MIKCIDNMLDKIDERKKQKALKSFPWRYIDRHGNRWFNTCYRCSFTSFRKWC